MLPFIGQAWLGMVPGVSSKLLGLSKFARLTNWVFSRPQIQEEATVMLAEEIEEATKADGVAVIVKAQHLCMTMRGVKDQNATMTTSIMRGLLFTDAQLRAEFLALIK
jgi:GTP cyclohydrolase I